MLLETENSQPPRKSSLKQNLPEIIVLAQTKTVILARGSIT